MMTLPAMRQKSGLFVMYLQAYFTERDYQKTISLFHPGMCGFGTGRDEVSFSYDDSISRYARDIEQCPAPIEYEERFINARLINKNTAIIMAGLDIAVANNDERIEVRDLRLSVILVKVRRRWLLQHILIRIVLVYL